MSTEKSIWTKLLIILAALLLTVIDFIYVYWIWKGWFDEPSWGWSLPQRREAAILIAWILAVHSILFLVLRKTPTYLFRTILMTVASIALLLVGMYVISYTPSRLSIDQKLSQLGITPSKYAILPPCKKIEIFAEVGYDHLSIEPGMLVLVPSWMNKALEEIPRDTLIDCINREIEKQLPYLDYDEQRHEVALKKIHALLFKVWDLHATNDSQLLELENIIICQKKSDPYGQLSLVYYVGLHNSLPSFPYLGKIGVTRLRYEVCRK
jgi:hypothetical protein